MSELLDKAKNFGNDLLQKAQGLLCKDGFLAPVVFSVKGEQITPVLLKMATDEDKDVIPYVLKKISSDAEYIIAIMDSYVKPVAEDESPPTIIKGHPDAICAIVVFLYLKDCTFIRNLTYIKNEDGRYNFFDQDWEEVLKRNMGQCRFSNPFNESN